MPSDGVSPQFAAGHVHVTVDSNENVIVWDVLKMCVHSLVVV